MLTAIAMGKISAEGAILKASPGITVSPINLTDLYNSPRDSPGYEVVLPDRLVCDNDYIVQLTAENFGGKWAGSYHHQHSLENSNDQRV